MGEPRQPQDRKPKQEPAEGYFTFTAGGEQYTMPKRTRSVVTPGYNRRHRKLEDEDRLWTILEDLADRDESILDAFEVMSEDEWQQMQRDLAAHLGATPGESTRSST
jgi:hypothetical protein